MSGARSLPNELRGAQVEFRERFRPFHWMLEFPEVFHGKRQDPLDSDEINQVAWMDAFIGNPPFMGGSLISGALGSSYLEWLQLALGSQGYADYSAQFFRRAFHLLGEHGTFGLIATNTIGQGDTRNSGLQVLLRAGGAIYAAHRSMPWPGQANVAVAVVHVAKGRMVGLVGSPVLDGVIVPAINSRLRPSLERKDPRPLGPNAGMSYQGVKISGQGFILAPDEARRLIARRKENERLIWRYIGGEELNSDPDPAFERYVINFGAMSLGEAEAWPELIEIVRRTVKPERDRANRDAHRINWWLYGDKRPALYAELRVLRRCLVCSLHSKHLIFAFTPANQVFSHALLVCPVEAARWLAVLQSRVHEGWARLLSSSLEDRLRYAPSDCFETFPFPLSPAFDALDTVGERLDSTRSAYMAAEKVGLTTTYNRLKDPAETDRRIIDLRTLHEDLDRAVLAAYGWSDISVPPCCGATPKVLEAFDEAVIDRLFALNEERARQEELEGPGPKKAGKGRGKAKKAAATTSELPLGTTTSPKRPRR